MGVGVCDGFAMDYTTLVVKSYLFACRTFWCACGKQFLQFDGGNAAGLQVSRLFEQAEARRNRKDDDFIRPYSI